MTKLSYLFIIYIVLASFCIYFTQGDDNAGDLALLPNTGSSRHPNSAKESPARRSKKSENSDDTDDSEASYSENPNKVGMPTGSQGYLNRFSFLIVVDVLVVLYTVFLAMSPTTFKPIEWLMVLLAYFAFLKLYRRRLAHETIKHLSYFADTWFYTILKFARPFAFLALFGLNSKIFFIFVIQDVLKIMIFEKIQSYVYVLFGLFVAMSLSWVSKKVYVLGLFVAFLVSIFLRIFVPPKDASNAKTKA